LLYKSINLFSITNKAKIIMAEIKGTSMVTEVPGENIWPTLSRDIASNTPYYKWESNSQI
jgi:hypothetical protein